MLQLSHIYTRSLSMDTSTDILKVISNETMSSVHTISIVTPSIYKSFFEKNAQLHGEEIANEEKLTNRLLDEKIKMCDNVQEKNSSHAIKLSDNTNRAIHAIQEQDNDTLHQVLKETMLLRKEIESLKLAVYKDELTNVYNRKWVNDNFLDDANEIFTKSGVLAIIDLNYFKLVNDTYGHIVGDKVLVFIANQLKITKEKVVRYGGDEFMVFFSGVSEQEAFEKLNHIREKVISKKLKTSDASFRTSFSIGVASFQQGKSFVETTEQADKNMYEDKLKIKEKITGID